MCARYPSEILFIRIHNYITARGPMTDDSCPNWYGFTARIRRRSTLDPAMSIGRRSRMAASTLNSSSVLHLHPWMCIKDALLLEMAKSVYHGFPIRPNASGSYQKDVDPAPPISRIDSVAGNHVPRGPLALKQRYAERSSMALLVSISDPCRRCWGLTVSTVSYVTAAYDTVDRMRSDFPEGLGPSLPFEAAQRCR